jgi:hypothetical protein
MAMEWQAVDSTQLERIGYDEETQECQVEFSSGSTYSYSNVPKNVVDDIVNAGSPGRQFAQTLKFGYSYTRL